MTTTATLRTSKGDITVELFENQAPKTVRNFVGLATGETEWTHPATGQATTEPLYDGVKFHRVISGFMIQTGDPLGRGTGGPGYTIPDEFNAEKLFDQPYVLGMANTGRPNSGGSQFFITTVPTPWLNMKHTVFGVVTAGQDVVDAIESVPTGAQDRPVDDVVITSITVDRSSS